MTALPPSSSPSRRALLRSGALAALSAGLLGACSGERSRTPWTPEPTVDEEEAARRMVDGDLLLRAHDRLAGHRAQLATTHPRTTSQRLRVRNLTAAWATQQDRLEQLLVLGGIPVPEPAHQSTPTAGEAASATSPQPGDDADATTSPAGGPDQAAVTATGPDPRVVGEALRAALPEVLDDLGRASVLHRPMLVSLAAQHLEAARLLGAPVDWPPLEGPQGTAAVPVLARTRPAVFGLEVVAARSRDEERDRYESVLAAARSLTRSLTTLAAGAAPLPPLGYDLPEPLDTAEDRLALAAALVRDIPPAVLSVVDRAGGDTGQLRSMVRLVAEAEEWGHTLRVEASPFPGMTLP